VTIAVHTAGPVGAAPLGSRPPGRRRTAVAGWLFLSPALLLFLVFVLGPFLAAIALSLFSWDMLTPAHFTGLDNFGKLLRDPLVYKALGNTFIFAFASVVTHLIGGFLLALGVNSLRNRVLSYFVRTSLFFPFVISWAPSRCCGSTCWTRLSASSPTTSARSASRHRRGSSTRTGRCRRSSG
jgi:multiple sugar transport system permease protein